MELSTKGQARPLIFGEVLFDCFPNGEAVLGGAPFNVAWHLNGFGLSPLFISRVGTDDNGRRVVALMSDWGMDTKGIQHDPDHPTGTVTVSMVNGQPAFDIRDNQAFDYIETAPVIEVTATDTFWPLYHGSLAMRHRTTCSTLQWLTSQFNHSSFVDINLRPPWWDVSQVRWAIQNARWLKLNEDELAMITQQTDNTPLTRAQGLLSKHQLDLLVLTQGAQGAALLDSSGSISAEPPKVPSIIDTVGAGDAFSAVCILGLAREWSNDRILRNALEFSAAICTIRGATKKDRMFYDNFIDRWEHN